jgi:hypothetical protein
MQFFCKCQRKKVHKKVLNLRDKSTVENLIKRMSIDQDLDDNLLQLMIRLHASRGRVNRNIVSMLQYLIDT